MWSKLRLLSILCCVSVAQAEDLAECAGENLEVWTHCHGIIETDNFYYIGEFVDGKPHGKGFLEDAFGTS